jgi:RNA polymerase sigma factor (sigma-70 family)
MSLQSEAVVRSLGLLFNEGTQCGLADSDLLERFLSRSEGAAEHAFEGLVLRHGPMVLDVCRKVLGNPHDAQDAFQATFLALATRARSIRRHRSVGSWLHGVALRVARRARSDAARRRAHERRIAEMTTREAVFDAMGDEGDFQLLHEEVERLPQKYREPVVLCYLEGLTLETAAGQLGCPVGTLGVRLMRAREKLKARLTRRGVSRADGLLVAGPAAGTGSVVLPGALVHSTVGAAVRITSGDMVPAAASQLTYGVLRSMAMVRLAQVFAGILVATVGIGSFGWALGRPGPQADGKPANPPAAGVPDSWIGKKVVIKYSAPLMEGDQVVGDNVFRVYAVDRIDADRVKLTADDISGWIKAEDVVLLDQAIDFYTEVIRENPKHLAARVKRAQVREFLGGRAKGIAELTEAIEIGPPNAVVYGVRADMFRNDKDFDRAIADLDESIRLTPLAIGYSTRGQCRAEKGEYGEAIADYNESIRLDPTSGLTYLNRGLARSNQEEYDKAIADFSEAIKLGTKYTAMAHRLRGTARLDGLMDPKEAIADLTEAIRLDPKDSEAYYQRGRARATTAGETDKAIADFTQAIKLDPKNDRAYLERGEAWSRKGDDDKAIADFNTAIQLEPNNAETYRERGRSWLYKKEYERAIADSNEAIRLDPEDSLAYFNRGQARQSSKDFDRAIADFDEAIRLDPQAVLPRQDRGGAWFDKREYDKAIADFDEAIRLDPRSARAHLYRGLARSEKRDYDGAIADFDAVIQLDAERPAGVDPKGVYAHLNRGWARFKKRDYARAMADFDEAGRIDPQNPDAEQYRAWIWATCPDARFRDGRKAIESAERICKSAEWKVANYLATLAAAHAEAGDFDEAVRWQTKANAIESDEPEKAKGEARLELYREHKPYRDNEP